MASQCVAPFLLEADYANSTGYIHGRLCSNLTGTTCCLPCPLTEWVYPDSFRSMDTGADWVAVVSAFCCVVLLVSWAVLPVEKTHRHYLSISLTSAVMLLNMGFIIPLAAQPEQCADAITPNGMSSSSVCAASGSFIILGGWSGVLWVFLRSVSLHLQICWQVAVGRRFMWLAQLTGWGIPVIGLVLALVLSGVSFRFGTTCHINHHNSLGVMWIPLLVFASLTIVVQFSTFGYCIKVYLASLADKTASTEGSSGLPSYTNSVRTMTPRQAYRRVRRVIQLQWRGIAIVLIIVSDVIFFSLVFVFQDNTVAALTRDPASAKDWLVCLALSGGDKNQCLSLGEHFSVKQATVGAVLVLLAMNGIWLILLLGRWSIVEGWLDILTPASRRQNVREFVSVDARLDDLKKDTRSYEMLSRDASSTLGGGRPATKDDVVVTTVTGGFQRGIYGDGAADAGVTSMAALAGMSGNTAGMSGNATAAATTTTTVSADYAGRRTPDYFQTARYKSPARSFSAPRPPTATSTPGSPETSTTRRASIRWDAADTFAPARPAPTAATMSPPRSNSFRQQHQHMRQHQQAAAVQSGFDEDDETDASDEDEADAKREEARGSSSQQQPTPVPRYHARQHSSQSGMDGRHPLGMNRI